MSSHARAVGSKGARAVFPGWRMLGLAWVQGVVSPGIAQSGLSLFYLPLRRQLEVSSASMSLVFGLARVQQGAGDLVVGRMVDRVGARPLILWGGLVTGLGLVLLSFITSYWQLLLIFVGVVALARPAGHGTPLLSVANRWFTRRKALAMSIIMTSGSVGGAVILPLLALGISHFGWRDTLRIGGAAIGLLSLLVAFFIRSRPEDIGLEPDGAALPGGKSSRRLPSSAAERDFTVRQSMKTRTFWFLMLGIAGRIVVSDALAVHQIPLLVWKGKIGRASCRERV